MADAKVYPWNGENLTLSELSKATGCPRNRLKYLLGNGLSPDEAVELCRTTCRGSMLYDWKGKKMSISQIADAEGKCEKLIRGRMHRGWTLEQAVGMETIKSGGKTIRERHRAVEAEIAGKSKGLPPREAQRYRAAARICLKIMPCALEEVHFRCVQPMSEYAFESDVLAYCIRFEAPDCARLTAWYREHGFASDLNRTYKVNGNSVHEINGGI